MDLSNDTIFLEYCMNHDLKPDTIISYKQCLENYCKFLDMNPDEFINEAILEEENGIRMRKRKIKMHLLFYKKYLQDNDYSVLTIRNFFKVVKAIYRENSIELPDVKLESDKRQEGIEDIPSREHIQKALLHLDLKYQAIIYLMSSSGMGTSEITSLKLSHFVDSVNDYIDMPINAPFDVDVFIKLVRNYQYKNSLIVPTWKIIRIKTGLKYTTFSSPESVTAIINYLEYRPTSNLEDPLFRAPEDRKIINASICKQFRRLNVKCDFGIPDRQAFMRSHALRKYFATNTSKVIPKLYVDIMLGHKIKSQNDSYFKADPEDMKSKYIELGIPVLSIQEIEIVSITSEDKQRLIDLEANDKAREEIMELMNKKIKTLEEDLERRKRYENYPSIAE